MKPSRSLFSSAKLLLLGHFFCWLPLISAGKEGDACTLKDKTSGKCMLASICEPIVVTYTQVGRLSIDDILSCGLGTYEEIVCCPIVACCSETKVPTKVPTTNTTRTKSAPATTAQVMHSNRVDVPTVTERAAVRACRKYNTRTDREFLATHIIDGIPVDPGVYPHMAAIAFSNFGFQYRCGGSLISNRHVLTAAHCVNDLSDPPVHVRLGTVDIHDVSKQHKDIRISENITVHPEYSTGSKYNDIAILELAEEVVFNRFIQAACLETEIVDPPAYSEAYVAGWGFMNTTLRITSKVLLRAPLNIVPRLECNQSVLQHHDALGSIKNGIDNTLICAKDIVKETADACQGDSGGPLMYERDIGRNNYTIMGIICAGFGCATSTPGLYTRVSAYLDFIESVVWPNNVV